MRIAFYVIGNERRSNYVNGITIRYGGASASGTDTSVILVAEYLASVGHEVIVACEKTLAGEIARGVTYTNLNFDKVDNKTFDVLVSMLWVTDYENIPITVTKGLIYWSHMQWLYGIREIVEYSNNNNLKLGVVHVSEWEKQHTNNTVSHAQSTVSSSVHQIVIPNAICDDVITDVNEMNLQRNPHKITFHAAWARGGSIVYDVVNELEWGDKELHVFDYLMNININWGRVGAPVEEQPFLHKHGGGDKLTIFKHLAESEYFIYPLYTPYQDVHKDTFSCVVAEAIALGAMVITYPVGAPPEYFGDHCVWLDIPEGFDLQKMQAEPLTKDLNGVFTNIAPLIEKIKFLESNPHIKENIRSTGKEYILNTFNVNTIGKKWELLLENLI
jgi:glycosyltransferase involved in cell wall biosynthesis